MKYLEFYIADKYRYGFHGFHRNHALRYLRLLRKAQCSNGLLCLLYRLLLNRMTLRYGLEIPWCLKVGKRFYLGHAFNITINPKVEIGEWCNIHKGVTIGQQNRGKLEGAPKIGNFVWIGVNSTIVGKVEIGDDVLIAPGAYVNCDVPSHSVVIGNPCQIHHKDNATEGYINNVI